MEFLSRTADAVEMLLGEGKSAIRSLRRAPVFACASIAILGVSVAASLAVYSVAENALLRTFPGIPEIDRVVRERLHSYPHYVTLAENTETVTGLAAYRRITAGVSTESEPIEAQALLVTANYFTVLDVPIWIGRDFQPVETSVPGERAVAILSNGFWQRSYGGDPALLGRTITLNGTVLEVIGVAAPNFRGTEAGAAVDLFLPVTMWPVLEPRIEPLNAFVSARASWLVPIGRLREGVSLEQANAELNVIYGGLRMRSPMHQTVQFRSVRESAQEPEGGLRGQLALLAGAVAAFLLLACANVSGLIFARNESRMPEFGVRLAIGATRARLVRQLCAEVCVIAVIAGALAVAIVVLTSEILGNLQLSIGVVRIDTQVSWRGVIVSGACIAAVALLCGLAPCLGAARRSLAVHGVWGRAERAGAGRGIGWRAMVSGQIALSLVLLVCTTLLVTSLQNRRALDLGFVTEQVIQVKVRPEWAGHSQAASNAYLAGLLAALDDRSWVASTATAREPPLTRAVWTGLLSLPGLEEERVVLNAVSGDYFRTLGVPLRGSTLDSAARDQVVLSGALARRLWGTQEPIGRAVMIAVFRDGRLDLVSHEVVGVAGDTAYSDLHDVAVPLAYLAPQSDEGSVASNLLIKVTIPPSDALNRVENVLSGVDPGVPFTTTTLQRYVDEWLSQSLVLAITVGLVSLMAWVLALAGLYVLLAYNVTSRTHEIGIRVALGADKGAIVGWVLGPATVVVMVGIGIGLAAAIGGACLLDAFVFGIAPTDGRVLGAACITIALTAIAAAYVPARRAAGMPPITALRGLR